MQYVKTGTAHARCIMGRPKKTKPSDAEVEIAPYTCSHWPDEAQVTSEWLRRTDAV